MTPTCCIFKTHSCTALLGLALIVSLAGLVTAQPLVTYHTVDVQFHRSPSVWSPMTNPTYGHRVLDPNLGADWVLPQDATINFSFETDTTVGQLVFNLRDRAQTGSIATAHFPLSQAGQILQLDLSTLFSGMVVDPDQVYFLGITLAGTPHSRHQVKATCNSLAVGMDHRTVTLREPVYEFGFYVDDGSVKPPRANIQEKLNPLPPHYFSTHAALGTIQGETVHGAIAHYTYRLHDTNLHPQIFARKWQLFKVENGNHTPMSTPGIPRGDRDVDLDFVAPADPGDEGVHYRLYCLTYDGRGVAGEPFSMGLTGDDLFYLKVGPDPTTQAGICLRLGWENTSGEVIPALDCDGNRFSEGKIFAMPVGPGIDPTEDYYGLRYAYATGSAGITAVDKHPDPLFSGGLHDPAYWHYKNPQPNQFPMSIQWRVRTRYGLSEYSGGTLVTYEPTIPDPDPFETNLSFDWRDPRPSEITPGMVVRI